MATISENPPGILVVIGSVSKEVTDFVLSVLRQGKTVVVSNESEQIHKNDGLPVKIIVQGGPDGFSEN